MCVREEGSGRKGVKKVLDVGNKYENVSKARGDIRDRIRREMLEAGEGKVFTSTETYITSISVGLWFEEVKVRDGHVVFKVSLGAEIERTFSWKKVI